MAGDGWKELSKMSQHIRDALAEDEKLENAKNKGKRNRRPPKKGVISAELPFPKQEEPPQKKDNVVQIRDTKKQEKQEKKKHKPSKNEIVNVEVALPIQGETPQKKDNVVQISDVKKSGEQTTKEVINVEVSLQIQDNIVANLSLLKQEEPSKIVNASIQTPACIAKEPIKIIPEYKDLKDNIPVENKLRKNGVPPEQRKFVTIDKEFMQMLEQTVTEKKGKILSQPYQSKNGKNVIIELMCEKGERWEANLFNVINENKWCRCCKKGFRLSIKVAQEAAVAKGGQCLSEEIEYFNTSQKLWWKCYNLRHDKFQMTLRQVRSRGDWCKLCNVNVGEDNCRIIFELLFPGYKFINIRVDFIISGKGNNLELDGYCEELDLAFEHQGEQHYVKGKFKDTDGKKFEEIKEHDRIKVESCNAKGISLIVIPYTEKDNYVKFIYEEIKRCAINNRKVMELLPKECPKITKIDIDAIINQTATSDEKMYAKLKEKVTKLGGTIIGEQKCVTTTSKITVRCKDGHEFDTSYSKICYVRVRWCSKCGKKKKGTCRPGEEIVELAASKECTVLCIYKIIDDKKIVLYKDGKYADIRMKKINEKRKIIYVCKNKHKPIETDVSTKFKRNMDNSYAGCLECKNLKGKKKGSKK